VTDYSRATWATTDTPKKWDAFMAHDLGNPSRYLAYYLIARHVWGQERTSSMAEVGFGGAQDFRWAWRQLHDRGLVGYTGYEIMADFVEWAGERYLGYDFRAGGFMDLEEYDITYTRHTLEHAHPFLWRKCLARLLRATRELCVLTWFMPPGHGNAMARNWTGQSWQNKYDQGKVLKVVKGMGFNVTIWPVATNEVWEMRRDDGSGT